MLTKGPAIVVCILDSSLHAQGWGFFFFFCGRRALARLNRGSQVIFLGRERFCVSPLKGGKAERFRDEDAVVGIPEGTLGRSTRPPPPPSERSWPLQKPHTTTIQRGTQIHSCR
jgi:hypothetical protein